MHVLTLFFCAHVYTCGVCDVCDVCDVWVLATYCTCDVWVLATYRCMACDKPVRVRQSIVPTAAHNSFQPYTPLEIAHDKKTNHAFPGRTRQMTQSPTLEDRNGMVDVRGKGHNSENSDSPKRWYVCLCACVC